MPDDVTDDNYLDVLKELGDSSGDAGENDFAEPAGATDDDLSDEEMLALVTDPGEAVSDTDEPDTTDEPDEDPADDVSDTPVVVDAGGSIESGVSEHLLADSE